MLPAYTLGHERWVFRPLISANDLEIPLTVVILVGNWKTVQGHSTSGQWCWLQWKKVTLNQYSYTVWTKLYNGLSLVATRRYLVLVVYCSRSLCMEYGLHLSAEASSHMSSTENTAAVYTSKKCAAYRSTSFLSVHRPQSNMTEVALTGVNVTYDPAWRAWRRLVLAQQHSWFFRVLYCLCRRLIRRRPVAIDRSGTQKSRRRCRA